MAVLVQLVCAYAINFLHEAVYLLLLLLLLLQAIVVGMMALHAKSCTMHAILATPPIS